MDQFTSALISGYTLKIPREYDWFAPFIGDWTVSYTEMHNDFAHTVKGEWYFRRILHGAGIEDLLICPMQKGLTAASKISGEYGLAIRIFNETGGYYDVSYASERCMKYLRFCKEGNDIVGMLLDDDTRKWVFSGITANSFRWSNKIRTDSGYWNTVSSIYATKKNG